MKNLKLRLVKDGEVVGFQKYVIDPEYNEYDILQSKDDIDWVIADIESTDYIQSNEVELFSEIVDDNGVQICEGDIIEVGGYGEGIVEFLEREGLFILKFKSGIYNMFSLSQENARFIKIGDIH